MSEPTENTEIPAEIPEPVEAPAPEQPEPAEQPEPEKRGRGRPAGAKDRVKRTVKKVRVEPIPAEPAAEPSQPSQPQPAPPPPPEPEPPSPRTMYRQTSEQLLHLRGLMQDNRRATAAQAYTQKLSMWPVV